MISEELVNVLAQAAAADVEVFEAFETFFKNVLSTEEFQLFKSAAGSARTEIESSSEGNEGVKNSLNKMVAAAKTFAESPDFRLLEDLSGLGIFKFRLWGVA